MNETTDSQLGLSEFNTLWNEYSYRHEHVWTWLHKLLIAALALSIAPYLKVQMPDSLKWFLMMPPLLSIILLLLAWFRVWREMQILKHIRCAYRESQRRLFNIDVRGDGVGFTSQIKLFYGLLWLVAVLNVIVSAAWINALPCGCGS